MQASATAPSPAAEDLRLPALPFAAAPALPLEQPTTIAEPVTTTKPTATLPKAVRRALVKPATTAPSTYERVRDSLGYGALIVAAGILWWFGAYFTLIFLRGIFPAVAQLGLMAWIIPVMISAAELAVWPKPTRRQLVKNLKKAVRKYPDDVEVRAAYLRARQSMRILWGSFIVLVVIDVGNSIIGLMRWEKNPYQAIYEGFSLTNATLPLGGWIGLVVMALCGIGFAFLPEKIVRWATDEIRTIWADED